MHTWHNMWSSRQIQDKPLADTQSDDDRPRALAGGPFVAVGLIIASLAALFGSALLGHMRLAANPFAFNDDVRQQIYPFLSYYQPGLFPDDYAARYYLACFPLGFRALYTLLALAVNPVAVSKVVPYLLFVVLLVALAYTAHRLSGWLGTWFTLAFVLSSPYFLARLTGGLPRGFGLALFACILATLVVGRMRLLAIFTVVSAAFYAPAAVLGGLCLATVTLIMPRSTHGDVASWHLRRRLLLVVATCIGCVVVLLPTLIGSMAYGATLGPENIAAYPELGPDGRYGPDDRAPFDALPKAMLKMVPEAFRGKEAAWVPGTYDWIATLPVNLAAMPALQWLMLAVSAWIVVGLIAGAWRDAAPRRLLVLLALACVAYLVSAPLAPSFYLPQRYTAYTIPLVAVVGLPAACRSLVRVGSRRTSSPWLEGAVIAGVCGAVLLGTGGTGNPSAGYVQFDDGNAPIYQFVASTPPDTVFAAWPGEFANNVPYLSHRSILINQEVHQVFHQRYADEMRDRMDALIDAYLATDRAPLRALYERYGVRYLVVDEQHFNENLPLYFAPFNQRISDDLAALQQSSGSAVMEIAETATVFRDGSLVVLDLGRIASP